MYTVLWTEGLADKWGRFETEEEVRSLLSKLKEKDDVCYDEIWIFNPTADEFAVNPDMF